MPYIVSPKKEHRFVEGYRVSRGLVIESSLYEHFEQSSKQRIKRKK